MKKIIAAVLTAVLLAATLTGCSGYANTAKQLTGQPSGLNEADNLALHQKAVQPLKKEKEKDAAKAIDGNLSSAYRSPARTGSLMIDLGGEKTFNTVVLQEKGWNIQNFRLQKSTGTDEQGNEKWEEFYRQDRIEDIRYCTFPEVTTAKLRLVVDESDAPFSIREIGIYQAVPAARDGFRVTAYIQQKDVLQLYENRNDPAAKHLLDREYFDVVNQILIIGGVGHDETGALAFSEEEQAASWKEALAYLRDFVGKPIKILQTVYTGSNPDRNFGDGRADTIAKAVAFLDTYGYDGINYDWEFPKGKQYETFSSYLAELKAALGDKLLSGSWYSWGIGLTPEGIAAQDQIEIMGYDTYDQKGNNNAFLGGCVQNIEYFLKLGVPPEKLSIGISYYGRPADASGVWVDYDNENYALGYFDNTSYHAASGTRIYFNGAQMTADKTAYAIARGIGGVMLFHLTEDKPYEDPTCLTRAVGDTIRARIATDGAH